MSDIKYPLSGNVRKTYACIIFVKYFSTIIYRIDKFYENTSVIQLFLTFEEHLQVRISLVKDSDDVYNH